MKIKGFIETSFVDWDGKVSCILFLGGCNLHCVFCHNHPLLANSLPDVPWQRIHAYLLSCREWLDGVVISGGEPLAQKQLPTLLQKIKKMGFFVKIDTNGTYPYRLKELLNQRLVDYVAMDIKAPFNKMYQQITDADVDLESIKESVRILLASNIDYELRTTLVPTFHKKEQIRQIAESIRGARRYVLQGFEPEGAREPSLRTLPPMEAEEVEEMIKEARRYIKDVRYRGRWSITRVQGSL